MRSLRHATRARLPLPPREKSRLTAVRQPPPWERLLDQARQQAGPEPVVARPVARVLLYVVDAVRSSGGDLVLLVMERSQRKDGKWGKEKRARVPIAELPLLADEHDREILPLLQTASGPSSSYYYGYTAPTFVSEVRVPADMVAMLMPRLSATGRLHMRTGPDEMKPASYDGERAWELALVVERDAARPYTDVVGQLRRGDECVDLAVPLVLARAGWLLFPDCVSRFEHFHAFGMVATLCEHQRIRVPRGQEDKLLAKLLALPGLPRLVLPAELALREIAVPPQPVLKIGPPDQRSRWRTSDDRPVAELLFDYQGAWA